MPERPADTLSQAIGRSVTAVEPRSGGAAADAFLVTTDDGERLFAKRSRHATPGALATEAAGLRWLADAGAVRVPAVVAVLDDEWLVLEWIDLARRDREVDARLGAQLAALHRAGAPGFGLDHDNYVGPLPQANGPCPTWAEFYLVRRLEPTVRAAVDSGELPSRAVDQLDRLASHLVEIAGPPEPPARLHGDLWSGNALGDRSGRPWLVDPAAYGGHREVDLAMMRLFGGFDQACFDAYHEAFPLADGAADRVALWQLYPLLVHTVLFGGGYAGSALGVLERYA